MDHQQEMAYGESVGHMINNVTWPVAGGRRCARLAKVGAYTTTATNHDHDDHSNKNVKN